MVAFLQWALLRAPRRTLPAGTPGAADHRRAPDGDGPTDPPGAPPTSGAVRVAGTDLTSLTDRRLTLLRRDKVGFVFQQFNLLPTLTAAENIALPSRIAGRRPDPLWIQTIVETVGLGARLGHRPDQLSGGQQQRVAAARALASKPEIVFADEPTGALDSQTGEVVLRMLRRHVDAGAGALLVTHDARHAAWADRIVFLRDGRVVDETVYSGVEAVLTDRTAS